MFDNPNLPKIETPPGVKPDKNAPEIFTMPEKFRGLAGKVTPPQVKPAAVPPPVVPPVVKPPLSPLPPKPLKKSKMSKTTKTLVIASVVLIVTLLAAAIYVYFALRPLTQTNTPVIVTPTTKPITEVSTNTSQTPVEEPVQETPTETSSPFPTGTTPGRDTDSDGLSDAEELLYRTNSKKPDTDSDGYLDGNEVFHGYDPNAPEPARLSDSPLIGNYTATGIYSVYYPLAWRVQEDLTNPGNVLFVVPSGEAISISLEAKSPEISLADWFSGTSPASDVVVTAGKTKTGYSMLETEDRMTVYVDAGDQVVVLSYQNTVKATIDYLATFEMMMNTMTLETITEPVYVESGVE